MSLSGTLVKQTSINSNGDALLEIFSYKTYLLVDMSPLNIKSADLVDGDWGIVGSVFILNYFYDGIEVVAKEVIDAIDGDNKFVRFKVIGGTLMDLYKSFSLTIHVDTNGPTHLVTWTLAYEKLNENIEDPKRLMEICLNITNDVDIYQQEHNI